MGENKGQIISIDEQLARWVVGEPVHNADRDECCPDFSCCQPELLAPRDLREKFANADREGDEKAKWAMLGMFLGAAMSKAAPGMNVHIAGEESGHA